MTTAVTHAPVCPPLPRLARRIHDQLLSGRKDFPMGFGYGLENLTARAQQLAAIRRRWQLCQRHGLLLAGAKVLEELQDVLRSLPEEAAQVTRAIPPSPEEHPVLSPAELVKELEHLEDEWGPWRYEPGDQELIVTTEPIVLEEHHLGPFEIRLSLNRLGGNSRQSCYKVVALEPHPASSNDAVTHPHVSDQHLCEGDAAAPITAALAEGRLVDFFVLVRCVLTTYNPGSPYVALDDWDGYPCHECGTTVSDDDRHDCTACDHTFCDDCVSFCRICDETLCLTCLEECPACQERVCARCLQTCSECGQRCCRSCLESAEGSVEGAKGDLCPECRTAAATITPSTSPTQGAEDDPETTPVACAQPAPAATKSSKIPHLQSKLPSNPPTPRPHPPLPPQLRAGIMGEEHPEPGQPQRGRRDAGSWRPENRRLRDPVLRFTPYAWAKFQFFCHAGDTEIGGFGITEAGDLLLVTDFVTVTQRVSVVTVAFDDAAVADFVDDQVDQGRTPAQCLRVWLHTHPGSSPTPSGVDEETFARSFGSCDWAVMAILAKGGQTYARLRFNAGPGGHLLIPVQVDYAVPFAGSAHDAWEEEYFAHIHPEPIEPCMLGTEDRLGQVAPSASRGRMEAEPWDIRAQLEALTEMGFLDEDEVTPLNAAYL